MSPLQKPMTACQNSHILSTIATSSSPTAAAFACTKKRSTSPTCSQDKNSASRKSTTPSGSSPSCTTISDISTWNRGPCRPSTIRSARDCHPCLRYKPLPMSPGCTKVRWRRGCPPTDPPKRQQFQAIARTKPLQSKGFVVYSSSCTFRNVLLYSSLPLWIEPGIVKEATPCNSPP